MAYEALSWGRTVDDFAQAWALVAAADRANLGVAVDSFHMLARETPLSALDDVIPEKLFFVQLSDFMWSAPATPEERRETARHARVFPGEGAHSEQLSDMIRALDALGYEGDYSFEVFNDDYAQMPLSLVTQRAQRSVEMDHRPRVAAQPAGAPPRRDTLAALASRATRRGGPARSAGIDGTRVDAARATRQQRNSRRSTGSPRRAALSATARARRGALLRPAWASRR